MDFVFYILSSIMIALGFGYLVELFKINESLIKMILFMLFIVVYLICYFFHRKSQNERLEKMVRDTENKYIDRIIKK